MPEDLFTAMLESAQAEFSLALAVNGIDLDPDNDRERTLADTALAAGVIGALTVLRERDGGTTRH